MQQAAARLEELTIISNQIVSDLREGKAKPYVRVYWLRREIGRVARILGDATPYERELSAMHHGYQKLVE